MAAACAMVSPRTLKSAAEASSPSFTIGRGRALEQRQLHLVGDGVEPVAQHLEQDRDRWRGSLMAFSDAQVARRVDGGRVSGRDDGGGVRLLDDGRTRDPGARAAGARARRSTWRRSRRARSTRGARRRAPRRRPPLGARGRPQLRRRQRVAVHGAEVHELDRLLGARVAVHALVRRVERRARPPRSARARAARSRAPRARTPARRSACPPSTPPARPPRARLPRPCARDPRRRARRGSGSPPSRSIASARAGSVRACWCSIAAASRPNAASTPGASGTMTSAMPISSASATPCTGPAPPSTTSANCRGSYPRLIVTRRIWSAMRALITRMDARRRRGRVQAEPFADGGDRARRRRHVERHQAAGESLRVQIAEQRDWRR